MEKTYHKITKLLLKNWKTILIILGSFSLSLIFWGINLKAKWWIIDDHEIQFFLGKDKIIEIKEIPYLLSQTEIGKWGQYQRFRPTYYFLRIIESLIWRDNTFLWYLSRISIFAIAIACVWNLLQKYIGFIYAGLATLAITLSSYWVDIFTRLGPGETYAVFGLSIYVWGYNNLYKYINSKQFVRQKKNVLSSFLLLIGAVICIGSKENFLFLIIPTLWLIVYMFIKKKANLIILITTLLIFIFSFWVLGAIFKALSQTGVDVYQNNVSLKERFNFTFNYIPKVFLDFKFYIILIVSLLSIFRLLQLKNYLILKKYLNLSLHYYILILLLISLYLSQYFFYSPNWPTGMRYDFPGFLCLILYLVVFLVYLYKSLAYFGFKNETALSVINLCILGAFLLLEPINVYRYFRDVSNANVLRTNNFTQTIQSVSDYAKQNPEFPIIFESFDVGDFEPVTSVNKFLIANGVQNKFYLKLNNYHRETYTDTLSLSLYNTMSAISENGGTYYNSSNFEKYENGIDQGTNCIVLNFSGESTTPCKSFNVWPVK